MSQEYERLLLKKQELKKKKRRQIIYASTALAAAVVIIGGSLAIYNLKTTSKSSDQVEDTANQASDGSDLKACLYAIAQGTATASDYSTVGQYYLNQGNNVKARDTFEEGYKALSDDSLKEALSTIIVDVSQDTAAVQYQAQVLENNLTIDEYFPETLHLLEDEIWTATVGPESSDTIRSYTMTMSDGSKAYFSLGRNSDDTFTSQICYSSSDYTKYIDYDGAIAEILTVDSAIDLTDATFLSLLNDDQSSLSGTFTAVSLDSATGDITKISGTMTEGNTSQETTIAYCQGNSSADIYDLYNSLDKKSYTTMTGSTGDIALSAIMAMTQDEKQSLIAANNPDSQVTTEDASSSQSSSSKSSSKTSSSTAQTGSTSKKSTTATTDTSKAAQSDSSTATTTTPAASSSAPSSSSVGSSSSSSSAPAASSGSSSSESASSAPAADSGSSSGGSADSSVPAADSSSSSSSDTDTEWTPDLM